MDSNPSNVAGRVTIATPVVMAMGVVLAAGVVFAAVTLSARPSTDTVAGSIPAGTDSEARRAQIARLARDPDIAPELVTLLQGLQEDLLAQQRAQQRLQAQLAELKREQSLLVTTMEIDADAPADTPADAADDPERAPPRGGFRNRPGPVTAERLVTAGFSAVQARTIVDRADAIAMQRLNMRYQATREGWVGTEQYTEALSALPDLREIVSSEYGDDAYDRYLYASGRPNRLVVQDVLQDSPARNAGLQPGDRVLAMADERIYSTRDLINVASTGSPGELVPLLVEREATLLELYVPRGPLGIRGGRGFVNPDSP